MTVSEIMSCSSDSDCSVPDRFCHKSRCVQCKEDGNCPRGYTCVKNRCLRGVGRWWDTILSWWDDDRKRSNIKSIFLLLVALGITIVIVMIIYSSMNKNSYHPQMTYYTPTNIHSPYNYPYHPMQHTLNYVNDFM